MKRIPLRILHAAEVRARGCVLTRGIPFADGELERGRPVRVVDEKGEELDSQSRCLATWNPDLKFVKWLLVDFRLDLESARNTTVFVEYGDVVPAAVQNPVTIEEFSIVKGVMMKKVTDFILDNGVIRAKFRNAADFMPWLKVRTEEGWRDIFRGRPGLRLSIKDDHGAQYTSGIKPSSVLVEEAGELCTVVRVDGAHATPDDGRTLCPYTLRFHFYAGSGEIRIFHNFVFDGDPNRLRIADMSLRIDLDLEDITTCEFGGGHRYDYFDELLYLQQSDEKYTVLLDGKLSREGGRTEGCVNITGTAFSFGAAVRNMWQEYPKAIRVTREGVEIKIWPEEYGTPLYFGLENKVFQHDRNIKTFEGFDEILANRDEEGFVEMLWRHPKLPLPLKRARHTSKEEFLWTFRMIEKHAPERYASYNDIHGYEEAGYGAAKTTEIVLHVSKDPIEDMRAGAALIQDPPVPVTDGKYAASTGAMRCIGTADFSHKIDDVRKVEKKLHEYFYRLVTEPRERLRNYGMLVYGDLMCCHSMTPADAWLHFKDDPDCDIGQVMRFASKCYNNEANDQLYSHWGFALHFGERDQYLSSEAYGNNYADLGMIHAGEYKGLVHYHGDHKFSGRGAICHTTMPGLRLQYYLSGNRRLMDVIEENKNHIMGKLNRAGLIDMKGGLIRQFTTPTSNLFSYYEMTWDRTVGEAARRNFKWLCLALHNNCTIPITVNNGGEHGDDAWITAFDREEPNLFLPGGLIPELARDAVMLFGDREPIFRTFLLGVVENYMKVYKHPFAPFTYEVGANKVVMTHAGGAAEQIFAYAYEITRDIRYAAYCILALRYMFRFYPDKFCFFLISLGGWVPKLIHTIDSAVERVGNEALLDALDEMIRDIQEKGKDQVIKESGPRTPGKRVLRTKHIGRVSGYDM